MSQITPFISVSPSLSPKVREDLERIATAIHHPAAQDLSRVEFLVTMRAPRLPSAVTMRGGAR